ncbi:MAG: hypothetical protein CO186_11290 [Zetaproteobacteria bacterium CG_4_9_14_3_um_filter_49_83]|nr:MAG: hypothetical protein AUJ56_03620 [Zetaproteobacteria bacterium CG1_02_49_23]PIQ34711.1 MAG: hypothetical protein COW62_00975 [Zetaproteobacteria bacterium CG17_big_fil_post_rev_8_21_14_2_50_50_13]PIV30596.1 MAG: hypothetical protein COS35_05900 [Zetaproteobacteria bacterium CG02_land_8_20_14_3_00_50_9]PIY55006.1 MAG: hypothetical protein COZ00_11885 [Zetaproteobacteria bacterium CG_4_10_14_0_8_um_filter_49_80]PJA34294.1 MAG: hypothetical protein CO186_11290 [Zetaproteobacteria bacterium
MPQVMLKLLESNNSPEVIVEFQQTVGEFPHKIQRTFSRVSEEMTSLKIMCSDELYQMIEQFEELKPMFLISLFLETQVPGKNPPQAPI